MNLVQSLLQTAKTKGDRTAYIFHDEKTSYAQLSNAVERFASGLARLGIKQGDHVALIVGNSPHFIIGLYGAMRIGATVIPINPMYTASEMQYILQDSDVKAVIVLDSLLPMLHTISFSLPSVEQTIVCSVSANQEHMYSEEMKTFTDVLDSGSSSAPMPTLMDDDTAVILYTSGTTGKPKGAMLTHRNLYSNAVDIATYLQYTENDRVITVLPMFHVFCLTVALNAPIVNGAMMIILQKFSPADVFQSADKYKATVFAGVPTMYNFLVQYEGGSAESLRTLRLCVSGGASMPVALLEHFEKKFQVMISEGYGLSEASPATCFNPLDRPRKPGSIGMSISNVENKVVNELGDELPVGEVGELIVRGSNVMKGYYKMPEDTKAAIRNGWLYTGDLARVDEDGYFYIVDRKKDTVIVGGYNVYPREVEEVLYAHSAVTEAVVVGVPHDEQGEVVKAFVVLKDAAVTEEELIQYCSVHLVKYKVPALIEFLDELPKNATGKILRRVLRQQAMEA